MRDSNPLYDLMGGYYPGDPIPRKRYYGGYPSPIDFDSETFINDYIYEVKRELENLKISPIEKSRLIADLERTLQLQATPKKPEYDPMRALELGDEEDVAGVNVKLDINPVKWVKDPQQMMVDTGKQWFKDLANWSDYSSYVERNKLWDPLLKGKELDPLVEYAYGEHIEGGPLPGPKPFQLYDLGVYVPKEETFHDPQGNKITTIRDVDVFSGSAKSFSDFTKGARSSGARDKGLNGFARQAALSSSAELSALLESGKITDPQQITEVRSHLHRARLLRAANAIHGKGDEDRYVFSKSGEFAEFGFGIGQGIGKIEESLSKYSLAKGVKKNEARDELTKTIDSVLGDHEGSSLNKLKGVYRDAEAHFSGLGPSAKADFEKNFRPLRNMINNIEDLKISESGPSGALGVANQRGIISALQKWYSTEGAIKGGLDNMNRRFLENDFLKGPLRGVVFDPSNKDIIGTRRLMNVTDEALRFYKREDFYDLINKLERDGVVGVAADVTWNIVRERFNGWTPAKVVTAQFKKVHYFGLLYDGDYREGGDSSGGRLNNAANWVIDKSPLAKRFDNNFTLEITEGVEKAKKVTGRLKLKGDKSLGFGIGIYNRTLEEGVQKLSQADLIKLINYRERDFEKLVKSGAALRYGTKIDDARKEAANFRKWLKEYNDQLGFVFDKKTGLLVNSKENQKKLDSFLKALRERQRNPNYLSVTAAKAGILQKYSEKLNVLQENLFRRLYNSKLGKLVNAPAYLREVISKAVAKAVNSAISKALGSAIVAGTSGLGAIIYPIIEKTVQFVLNKVENTLGKIWEAIRKADVDIIESFVEDSAKAVIKTFGCCAIAFGFPIAITLISITGLLTSITPVDPTRVTEEGRVDEGGDYGTYGPGSVCPPGQCPVAASINCFKIVGNWPPEAQNVIEEAARFLVAHGGTFVNELCADYNGNLEVVWAGGNESCGLASVLTLQIKFGNARCYAYNSASQDTFNWLFAHEAAHMYHYANRLYVDNLIHAAQSDDGDRTVSTYRGQRDLECSDTMHYDLVNEGMVNEERIYRDDGSMEDFAETMSNYIRYHQHCPSTDAYADWVSYTTGLGYTAHYNLARLLYGL